MNLKTSVLGGVIAICVLGICLLGSVSGCNKPNNAGKDKTPAPAPAPANTTDSK